MQITWVHLVLRFPPFILQEYPHAHRQRQQLNRSLENHKTPLILDSFDILVFFCTTKPHWACIYFCRREAAKDSQKKREEEWGGKTKQILRHDAWGVEALQADRLSFIFLLNWGEDFQTPSEAEGIPANREEGRRRRCQSKYDPYCFIFIPCYCRKACGSPDNTAICACVYGKWDNLL